MSQQQLFIFILVTIIIGIAIIRGMAMLDQEYKGYAREGEIRNALFATAASAQAWYRRPSAMGGGGRSFVTISWKKLNIAPNTLMANFTMSNKQKNSFQLTAVSKEDSALIIKYIVYPDSIALVP